MIFYLIVAVICLAVSSYINGKYFPINENEYLAVHNKMFRLVLCGMGSAFWPFALPLIVALALAWFLYHLGAKK